MLALKYRPSTLDEVVGQKTVTAFLKAMIAKDRVPNVLLFTGPRGTGKTSTARIVANSILSSQGESFSDLIEIDAASHGGVDDIRRLLESMTFSGSRIVILDEAQSMSREAFNALLKAMEEPESNATYILVTTEPNRIPETIRSRCMQFDFKRISTQDIYERLVYVVDKEDRPDVEPELLEFIAFKADGGMRDALMMLDQAFRADIWHVSQYEEALGELDVGPKLLKACIESPGTAAMQAREALRFLSAEEITDNLIDTVADMLILREGGSIYRTGKPLEERRELVSAVNLPSCFAIMKFLWAIKTRSRQDNLARTLELAILSISHLFNDTSNLKMGPAASVGGLKKAEPAKKINLSDLADL